MQFYNKNKTRPGLKKKQNLTKINYYGVLFVWSICSKKNIYVISYKHFYIRNEQTTV